MKRVVGIVAFLVLAGAGTGSKDEATTVLYQNGPWTVFRFTNSGPDDPPDYCSARSANANGFLELLATKDVGCLSAEDAAWAFRERAAEVGFLVSGGGVYIDNATYYSNGLQVCAENAANDALIDLIFSIQGDAVDVYDDAHLKVGSFPASGRGPALEAWRSCREGL